jgi:hypothetical protein
MATCEEAPYGEIEVRGSEIVVAQVLQMQAPSVQHAHHAPAANAHAHAHVSSVSGEDERTCWSCERTYQRNSELMKRMLPHFHTSATRNISAGLAKNCIGRSGIRRGA